MIPEVKYTGELQRVVDLPRRVWTPEDTEYIVNELTDLLKVTGPCPHKPGDSAARERHGLCPNCGVPLRLWPMQAIALVEGGMLRGGFGSIGVGEGKTLITLLLPVLLKSERPVLLLPGGLIEKTQRERRELSYHWRVSNELRPLSYDWLGRVDAEHELQEYRPTDIIADEAHRLKNKRASVTRRVTRYMHAFPETGFYPFSGSIMAESLKEFAHLLLWAFKCDAPIPTIPEEIDEWAEALDHKIPDDLRRRPGALAVFGGGDGLEGARRGFQKRLAETPGVWCTEGAGSDVGCSIYLKGHVLKVAPVTEANFAKLRKDWLTPDDWKLLYAPEVYAIANELALGLHYVWIPRPPDEWRSAKQEWHAFARETIAKSRTYDSELHVSNACDAGKLPNHALERWRRVQRELGYEYEVKPIWHDTAALEFCKQWAKKPGIIWTEHTFFAERLAEYAGLTYYGAGGFAASGEYIEDAKAGSCVIASIDANREGKNLQALWHRNLLVCPPPTATWIEQTIARTHRAGQTADEVIVDVLIGCRENFDAVQNAIEAAQAIEDMTGKKQKLLLADRVLPSEDELPHTPRWVR